MAKRKPRRRRKTGWKIDWFGDKVLKSTRKIQRFGINATMAAAVIFAKANHTFTNRTTTLEGGIRIVEPARVTKGKVRGLWGVVDVVYALAIELGLPARDIVPVNGKALFWPGARHPVRRVHQKARKGKPYLRPAADAEYPGLAGRMRDERIRLFGKGRA